MCARQSFARTERSVALRTVSSANSRFSRIGAMRFCNGTRLALSQCAAPSAFAGEGSAGEPRMTKSNATLLSVIVCAMCVLAGAAEVAAQTYQGALRGAVRDPQGVIPGAE